MRLKPPRRDDKSHPESLKPFIGLSTSSKRQEIPANGEDAGNGEVIWGKHPIQEALRAGRPLSRILYAEDLNPRRFYDIQAMARAMRIPVAGVPRVKLDLMVPSQTHQGIVAYAAAAPTKTEADLEDLLAKGPQPPFVIILDGIQDPYNLGAIVRVADGAGASCVIIPVRGATGLTPIVDKASAGAVSWVPVVRVVNIARTINQLKAWGLFIWAATPEADTLYSQVDWTGPSGLVLGSEGRGIRPLVVARCDGGVKLPMAGRLASLNAATAAAILAFETRRQRDLHPSR